MPAPKYNIQLAINQGNLFFAELICNKTSQSKFGGCANSCDEGLETCLYLILDNLQIRLDNNILDNKTVNLYDILQIIIGGTPPIIVGPTVNAGEDRIVSPGGTQAIHATILEGSSPIDSIQWVQKSGLPATLIDATTPTLIIVDYALGDMVFTITVIDKNGVSASDDIMISVVLGYTQVKFGYTDTNPVGLVDTIELLGSIVIPQYSPEYSITFSNLADLNYLIIEEDDTEIAKDLWKNSEFNFGIFPDSKFRREVINGKRYYYSRTPFAFGSAGEVIDYKLTIKN